MDRAHSTFAPASGPATLPRGASRLLLVLAVNAIPLLGIWRYGWGSATTLTLYWFESLVGELYVFLRLLLHRQWTRDSWYDGGLLQNSAFSFPLVAFALTLAHGVFLWCLLHLVWPAEGGAPVDAEALRRGVWAVVAVLTLGFLIDLPKLSRRPFSWMQGLAERTLTRVVVVHLTIVGGIALVMWLHQPEALIGLFAGLKLLTESASSWPRSETADEAMNQ